MNRQYVSGKRSENKVCEQERDEGRDQLPGHISPGNSVGEEQEYQEVLQGSHRERVSEALLVPLQAPQFYHYGYYPMAVPAPAGQQGYNTHCMQHVAGPGFPTHQEVQLPLYYDGGNYAVSYGGQPVQGFRNWNYPSGFVVKKRQGYEQERDEGRDQLPAHISPGNSVGEEQEYQEVLQGSHRERVSEALLVPLQAPQFYHYGSHPIAVPAPAGQQGYNTHCMQHVAGPGFPTHQEVQLPHYYDGGNYAVSYGRQPVQGYPNWNYPSGFVVKKRQGYNNTDRNSPGYMNCSYVNRRDLEQFAQEYKCPLEPRKALQYRRRKGKYCNLF